jgi:hypothetical protein
MRLASALIYLWLLSRQLKAGSRLVAVIGLI